MNVPVASTARPTPVAGIIVAGIGVVYGYDLSTSAGALRYITAEFGLSTPQQQILTVTVVLGEVAGAIGGGPLANSIGRKKSTTAAAAAYAAFAVLSAVSISLPMLLAARLLVGMAVGVTLTVVPVFIAECAPAGVRGSLLVGVQLSTIFGVTGGYLIAYLLAGSVGWRWMLGLAALPAVVVVFALAPMPDTARWYVLKGRIEQARQALAGVDSAADVEDEIAQIADAVAEDRGSVFIELLRPPYRRATIFVVGLGFLAHVTGINATIYYSSQLFEAMGFTGDFGLIGLPAVVQLAGLVGVLVALTLVDQVGRRPILLSGIAMMVAADGLLVCAFVLRSGTAAMTVAVGFTGVLLFTAGFSFGFGAVVGIYAGECFPARLRSVGSSLMITADLVANAIVAAVFLTMLHSLGGAGTFTLFGVITVSALIFVYQLAPETKDTQLEDIRHFWGAGSVDAN